MLLQLDIHQLDETIAADEFVSQKCLLPAQYITNALKVGTWVKCYWSADEYAICQLFLKDPDLTDHNCCYLNATVKKGRTTPKQLHKLEQLQTTEATSLEVSIELTQATFVSNYKRYSLEYLLNVLNTLLQPIRCCVGCKVATSELRAAGIESISICAATGAQGNFASECVYCVMESTQLFIKEVTLTSNKCERAEQCISVKAFSAYEELRQLLQLAKQPQPMRLPMNALIIGSNGCGKSSLITEALSAEKCNYFAITPNQVIGQYPGETEALLRQIFQAAEYFAQQLEPKALTVVLLENLQQLCPAAHLITAAADVSNAMRICTQLMHLIDQLQRKNVLCLATTTSIDSLPSMARRPGRFQREIIITQPSEDLRAQLLQQLFAQEIDPNVLHPEYLEYIVKHTQGYVLADLALLVQNITQTMVKRGADLTTADEISIIKHVLSQMNPTSIKSSDVPVIKPAEGFASIAGMSQLKRELAVSLLAAYKQQPAFQRFGLRVPKGILLYGPPGCGKTKFAKCLAYEANMTFIATSGAEVYSPYVGVAEKFVARIFDTARRNAPCLIFFDEIDTLVGKRQSGEQKQHDVQLRILSTLLTEMDGIIHAASTEALNANYNIMVVAATNRPDMLDDALIRPGRFDKLVHVPPPDYQSRYDLFQLHATKQPFAADISIEELAHSTANYSGADISSLCSEAALNALHSNEHADFIHATDFNVALKKVKPSLTSEQIQKYYAIEKNIL